MGRDRIVDELSNVVHASWCDLIMRCEAAKLVGGIPFLARAEGIPIPYGWYFDSHSNYFLPPNFIYEGAVLQ